MVPPEEMVQLPAKFPLPPPAPAPPVFEPVDVPVPVPPPAPPRAPKPELEPEPAPPRAPMPELTPELAPPRELKPELELLPVFEELPLPHAVTATVEINVKYKRNDFIEAPQKFPVKLPGRHFPNEIANCRLPCL